MTFKFFYKILSLCFIVQKIIYSISNSPSLEGSSTGIVIPKWSFVEAWVEVKLLVQMPVLDF